ATIGGGVVLDPAPPRRRAKPWAPGLSAAARLALLVEEAGGDGLAEASLPVRLGLPVQACADAVARDGSYARVGGRLFQANFLASSVQRLEALLVTYHAEHPLEEWVPVAWLRSALAFGEPLVQESLLRAVAGGRVEQGAAGVCQHGWKPALSATAEEHKVWLLSRLETSGGEPPSVSELRSERSGNDPVPLLRILERAGLVTQVEPDRYYATDVVGNMVRRLQAGMTRGQAHSPAELRELLGMSRKYLIPFLEYCDRQRVTERVEHGRVLGR
ncbi:MAG: SelB C-terminal domain-containing protein, partial [Gemmatimonadaceae bacterium]